MGLAAHHVEHGADRLDRRARQDAVAEVEDVARASVGLVEHLARAGPHDVDLLGELGHVGEDRHAVGAGLDEATAALFPARLEESTIGKKPVGWDVTKLETVLSVLEVGGRPKGGVGGITSGIPSIGAESIVGVGQFDFAKTKYVPVEFFEGMKKGHIQSHDVLLYKDGGRPGEYEPHVSMFGDGFPFEKCSINEHVYRIRTNDLLSQ